MATQNLRRLTLADGNIINDIPEDMSVTDIAKSLSESGYAVPADIEGSLYREEAEPSEFSWGEDTFTPVEKDPNTVGDYFPIAGELAAGLAAGAAGTVRGAQMGAVVGTPFGLTVPGAFLGGLAGGAVASGAASGAGRIVGEFAEDLYEGTRFDPVQAINNAVEVASTTAMFSAVFGVAAPVVKSVGSSFADWVKELPNADQSYKVILDLQQKMKDRGASLLPIMVTNTRGARVASSVANVSEITKQTVDRYFKTYDDYMGEQTKQIVQSLRGGTPLDHGRAVVDLVDTTEEALKSIVKPFYDSISTRGNIPISDAREELGDLAAQIRKKYRGQRAVDKQNPDGTVSTVYEDFTDWSGEGGKFKGFVTSLENIPTNLTFAEAHEKLSYWKKMKRDIESGVSPNTNLSSAYNSAISALQQSMDVAAEKLSPTLRRDYKNISTTYREGMEQISTDYLNKVMRLDDPAKVGGILTQDGLTIGLRDVRNLMQQARQYRSQLSKDAKELGERMDQVPDPLEGIRKGYLENLMGVEGVKGTGSLVTLRNKLKTPKFKATFDVLFEGSAIPKKINSLLDELAILERGTASSDSAFSLTVRGSELGAAQQAIDPTAASSLSSTLKGIIPGLLARNSLKPESVDKTINLIKTANAYQAAGKTLPKGFWVSLNETLGKGTATGVGVATGTVIGSQFVQPQQ